MRKYEITHEDVLMFSTLLGTTQGLIEILESVGHKTVTDAARVVMDDAERHLRSAMPIVEST